MEAAVAAFRPEWSYNLIAPEHPLFSVAGWPELVPPRTASQKAAPEARYLMVGLFWKAYRSLLELTLHFRK